MEPLLALRAGTPGAVTTGAATIGGRPVVMARFDLAVRRGALHPADGETLAHAAETALASRLPLVVTLASSGADVTEGLPSVHGWGVAARRMTACSGVVPIVIAVIGPAVSGPALLLGLADQVVMTEEAYAFLSGPSMVKSFTGVAIDKEELGGAVVHDRWTGLAALVVADEAGARESVEHILSYLPAHADEMPPEWPTDDPVDRMLPEVAGLIPDMASGGYDVRDVARAIVDDGDLLELRARWAPNLVTGLATIGGRPVGVVANQPLAIAGTLDIPASQKGAAFVNFCDSFNLPLLTLVDTPGFYPGKDLEWRGMIRHGAQLAFAYARATVPRVAVALRKAYGGAYIVMDSRYMGNDYYVAWPTAEIAVMGAKGAVEILHRQADPDARAALVSDYEERLLNPYVAAERGSVDAIIDPADTRREVAAAFDLLASKQEKLPPRRHDNTPL
ncbi:MAG: acyl-CoA carboxylase subunit beta [Acidimicrobiales bacterium]